MLNTIWLADLVQISEYPRSYSVIATNVSLFKSDNAFPVGVYVLVHWFGLT